MSTVYTAAGVREGVTGQRTRVQDVVVNMKYESHSQNHNRDYRMRCTTNTEMREDQRMEKDGRFIEEFKKKYLGKSDAMVKGIEQIKFSSSDG